MDISDVLAFTKFKMCIFLTHAHIGMHGWHFRCIFNPCAKLSLASLKSVLPPMLMENLWTKMPSDPSMGSLRELAKPRSGRERAASAT